MITEKFLGQNLIQLLRERGQVCMSILLPTHRTFPESRQDPIRLKNAVTRALHQLEKTYPDQSPDVFTKGLDDLTKSVDFDYNLDGLGLFISPGIQRLVRFPFQVEEKIVVTDNFELRDILYRLNYAQPYYVLMLSRKRMRLFRGSWDQLQEMKDGPFPEKYEDPYEYSTPSRSIAGSGHSLVKSFEPDKSVVEENRFKAFFRQSNEWLMPYLQGGDPLVLAGPEEEIEWFEDITRFKKHIADKVKGNYEHLSVGQMTELIWPVMREYFRQQEHEWIGDIREKVGTRRGMHGLLPIWKATVEGRAHQLFVEKDFRQSGYKTDADGLLHKNVPPVPHTLLPDAVDDLIEMVIDMNGEVYFVDNDALVEFERVALVTRY